MRDYPVSDICGGMLIPRLMFLLEVGVMVVGNAVIPGNEVLASGQGTETHWLAHRPGYPSHAPRVLRRRSLP